MRFLLDIHSACHLQMVKGNGVRKVNYNPNQNNCSFIDHNRLLVSSGRLEGAHQSSSMIRK